MDLSKITTKTAFNYAYLTKKMFPYIKPLIPRIILALFIAMPLGLLDGVTAFALKPCAVRNNHFVPFADIQGRVFSAAETRHSSTPSVILPI